LKQNAPRFNYLNILVLLSFGAVGFKTYFNKLENLTFAEGNEKPNVEEFETCI